MDVWSSTFGSFLLAFSALFSIVNPISGAMIYSQVTADRTHAERLTLARKIGIYAALVLLVALWGGASVMSFFGITLGALRIAGGVVVSVSAWEMLYQRQQKEDRKIEQAAPAAVENDIAFFPMTIPFTTGPGTISVAIALSSTHPPLTANNAPFFIGVSLAALAIAALVWVSYSFADTLVRLLGPGRSRVVTRLFAFLLLCIGVQILLNGVSDTFGEILARYANQIYHMR
ncbi:MAG: MarC family protein [Beijerinckiaceae bacterium]|nr:MarC family protein [Beijerinckiaceae bacterium]